MLTNNYWTDHKPTIDYLYHNLLEAFDLEALDLSIG